MEALARPPRTNSTLAESSEMCSIASIARNKRAPSAEMPESQRRDDASRESTQPGAGSVLRYTRAHDLSRDFAESHPMLSKLIPTVPVTLQNDLQDASGLPTLTELGSRPLTDLNDHERFPMDRNTADFLSSLTALSRNAMKIRPAFWRELRLDLPLLISDPEIDMECLYRRNTVYLRANTIEPFALSTEADESIEWPSPLLRLSASLEAGIRSEKLEIDQDVIEYLHDIVQSPQEELDLPDSNDKQSRLEPLSPPLLPWSSPQSIRDIDPIAAELNFTSSPEDLLAAEAQALHERLLAADDTISKESQQSNRFADVTAVDAIPGPSRLQDLKSSSSPSQRHYQRLQSLKMEVPLTPRDAITSPQGRLEDASLSQAVVGLLPELSSDRTINDLDSVDADWSAYFEDFVARNAASVEHQAANEELLDVDTILRIKVLEIDQPLPQPPWIAATPELMSFVKNEMLKGENHWAGLHKLEQSLPWRPFPAHFAKINLEDKFDDGSLERYSKELELYARSDVSLVVRTEGDLSLLHDGDSEYEDLEVMQWSGQDFEAPVDDTKHPIEVPRRYIEQEEDHMAASPAKSRPFSTNLSALLKKRKLELELPQQTGFKATTDTKKLKLESEAETVPVSANTLSGFLSLHGQQDTSQQPHADISKAMNEKTHIVKAEKLPLPPVNNNHAPPAMPHHLPRIDAPSFTHQVVISSTLITNRIFIRRIQEHLPSLEMIERTGLSPAKERSTPAVSTAPVVEADMVLSPGTGLLVTTLQKLKQKPLPGQSNYFGIRERITAAAPRHERLLIMVSEGRPTLGDGYSDAEPLDQRDCDALADVTVLVSRLDCEVEVQYVAGGEVQLAHWVAASVRRYATSHVGSRLLEDETLWERFLRTAGFDAFAAQMVLAMIKVPDDDAKSLQGTSNSTGIANTSKACGLAGFVGMDLGDRLRRFSDMMGGGVVLRRVSEVVDGNWSSAANAR